MLTVTPYVAFKGNQCREAIEFYKAAMGAELLFLQTVGESPMPEMGPPGNVMHSSVKIGETTIMMSDDMMPAPEGEATAATGKVGTISLALGMKDKADASAIFGNLAAGGGVVIMPLEKTYWAAAFGIVQDRFGIVWMINCES